MFWKVWRYEASAFSFGLSFSCCSEGTWAFERETVRSRYDWFIDDGVDESAKPPKTPERIL